MLSRLLEGGWKPSSDPRRGQNPVDRVTSTSLAMALEADQTGLFQQHPVPFNFIEDAGKDELSPSARSGGRDSGR